MFWTVSDRVQIREDYQTGELKFNQIIELPYTQHEADCENLMGVINSWKERKFEASKKINASRARFNPGASLKSKQRLACYMDDYREAKMCYDWRMMELDHLIRHNAVIGAERIHSDCEACDKIETTNAILKRPWLAQA
jgi:hypothetical protein